MSSDKWDDEKLKKILSDAPEIRDTRTKEELMTRLKLDERLNEVKPQKNTRWIPAFVAVAALLIVSLLLPSMLGSQEDKALESSADMIRDIDVESAESEDAQEESAMDDNSPASFSEMKAKAYSTAVYDQDIVDGTVFHLGLASDAATSIPVTFVIPNRTIKEDFGKLKPTSLELYEKYASRLDEQALGFSEYHPYKGELTVAKDELVHILPYGHGYDVASATMSVYTGTLQDTFYGFKDIRFQHEDGSTVEFDQVGEPSRPLKLTSGVNHYNYYLFVQEDGRELLSPSFSKSYETVEEALLAMKKEPNDIYLSVIPDTVNYTVTTEAGVTKVVFTEQVDLGTMEIQKALQMIEGLLLTAASFNKQLEIENVMQVNWYEFDFSKPLEIPIGPNLMPFLLKE